MALVIEDGTKVADANSYVTLEYANDYHTKYGNTEWTDDDDGATRELKLIQACQSLDLLYGKQYASLRLEDTELLWPREAFCDQNLLERSEGEIPVELKKAQCELALGLLTGSMSAAPQDNPAQSIIAESASLPGGLSSSTTYSKPQTAERYEGYRKVDLLLWPILKSANPTLRLVL